MVNFLEVGSLFFPLCQPARLKNPNLEPRWMPPETHPAVAATTHDVLARTAITSLKRFACPCAASRRIQAVARRRGRLTGWRLATNERDAQIRAVWCRSALRGVRVKDRRHDVSHRTSIRHIMHTIHLAHDTRGQASTMHRSRQHRAGHSRHRGFSASVLRACFSVYVGSGSATRSATSFGTRTHLRR